MSASNEFELDQYLNTSTITLCSEENFNSFSIVDWCKSNKSQFLTLARIYYNVYAVLGMSAKAEHRFISNLNKLIMYSETNYNRS